MVHTLYSESVNSELIELTHFSCSETENSVSHLRVSQLRVQVLTQSWLNLLIETGPRSTAAHRTVCVKVVMVDILIEDSPNIKYTSFSVSNSLPLAPPPVQNSTHIMLIAFEP